MHGKAHMWRSVDKVVKYAIYATIFLDIYDIGCIGYTYLYNLISEHKTNVLWLCYIVFIIHVYILHTGKWSLYNVEKNIMENFITKCMGRLENVNVNVNAFSYKYFVTV